MEATEAPVAIVTAATRGMGEAIARELARKGYRLALLARSPDIQDLAAELGAIFVRGSVSDPADLETLVGLAQEKFGRVDAVINNTGHPPTGDLLRLTDSEWHEALDLVLLNVVRMSRLVTPGMIAAGRGGAFVNISTVAAVQPDIRFPLSGILRAGLANFAKMYADLYAVHGIRMNNILPGTIDSWPQPPERIAEVPAKRLGTVAEIAGVAAFLVSDEATYVNGQNLVVDGGLIRGI
ncbi:MAG: 3-oxoacyl-ACP reductase [Sphingomonadales bacterium]|nr:3-oxoacyl-ACP reductase [Sphingomonadales bacterium]